MPASSSDSTENGPGPVIPRGLQDARAEFEPEQSFLTRLLETLPYPVSYIDADLVYQRCNSAAAATVGRTPDQIIGQSVASIVGAESEVMALLRRVLSSNEPYHGILAFPTPGSTSSATYQVSYLPDTDEEGRTVGVFTNVVDVTDLVQSRSALSESEERLRLALEAARFGTFDFNIESGETYWDERQRELWDIPADVEVDYQSVLGRVHPDDRERAADTFEAALSPDGEGIYQSTYRILRPDGSTRWLAARGRVLFSGEGRGRRAVRVIGVERDVTDATQAEDALRESEERYRQLFESESDAILLVDQETGRILEANAAAEAMYGYDAAELQGLTDVDLSAEPDQTRASAHQGAAGENVGSSLRMHRRKGGEAFPAEITGRAFELHGRQVRVAAVRDVSERKRGEEELRRSEEQYRSIVETAAEGIIVATTDGKFTFANRAMADMLGYSIDEILGRSGLDFTFEGWLPQVLESRAELDSGAMVSGEWKARRRDGSLLWTRYNSSPIFDEQGRRVANLAMHTDITERKKVEAALHEREARLRHHLENTPLAVVEWDADFVVTRWAGQAERCSGGSRPRSSAGRSSSSA